MHQRDLAPSEAQYGKLKEELRQQAEFYRSWPDAGVHLACARQFRARLEGAGFFDGFIGQLRVPSPEYASCMETVERL